MLELEELISHSINGDKNAFDQIYNLLHDDLYRIAHARLNNIDDIEDAIQETMLSAYKSINKFDNADIRFFKTWLIKILINECNKIYNRNIKHLAIFSNLSRKHETNKTMHTEFDKAENKIEIEKLFKILNYNEKLCMSLCYYSDYSIQEVADILNTSPNTVKSRIARSKKKVQKYYIQDSNGEYNVRKYGIGKVIVTIGAMLVLTTGVVFAKDIINFIGNMFNLTSINIKNDSIVDAITNKDYIQNVDMDYVALNDKYKIKVDYLMLDDINLYMVFNLQSNIEIPSNYELSILDLIITDKSGKSYYNENNLDYDANFFSSPGWNNVATTAESVRELFFLMTNGIDNPTQLNIKFTKLVLYNSQNPNNDYIEVNCNCDFNIDIDNKFKNREIIEYAPVSSVSKDYEIEKCIANETGLYLLYKTKNPNINFKFLNRNISCNQNLLGITSDRHYIMLMQFNITKTELQKLKKIQFNDSLNTITLKKVI